MELKKPILVAPLNWGLGHAARCIPIISALLDHHFEPIIASDGEALELLMKEFPDVRAVTLPSYQISYSKNGRHFKYKMIKDSPKILKAIKAENKELEQLIKDFNLIGIISDNRLGLHSKNVPSVIMTHQLEVLSGSTTWLSSKLHQYYIKKFDQCWVPDVKTEPSLSGRLGHTVRTIIPTKYIGVISRFTKRNVKTDYDLMVLLSGPEPQRSIFEKRLLNELKSYEGRVLFVKGKIENERAEQENGHFTIVNYMTSNELEDAINKSAVILARSGYTTIMDLAKLGKAAFLIPTPGQFEQEYLSKRFSEKGIISSCEQDEFSIDKLEAVKDCEGFDSIDSSINFTDLFSLFEGE